MYVNINKMKIQERSSTCIYLLPIDNSTTLFQTYVPTTIAPVLPLYLFQTYVPTTIAPVLPNTSGLSGPLFSAGVKTGMFIISDVSSMYSISYSKQ